jgi:hypothetical protein
MSGRCMVLCKLVDSAGPVYPGSVQARCLHCDRLVWISPATQKLQPDPVLLCMPCGVADALNKKVKTIGVTPETALEVKAWYSRN